MLRWNPELTEGPRIAGKAVHRKTPDADSRRTASARAVRTAGATTTIAAGTLAIVVTVGQMTAGASGAAGPSRLSIDHVLATQSSPLQSAIDDILAAQQQVAGINAALPFAAPSDQALLGTYTQNLAVMMLFGDFAQQQTNLVTWPYGWTAPAADPQVFLGAANPDDTYQFLPLAPNTTYEVTVQPGPGTEDLSFTQLANLGLNNTLGPSTTGGYDLANAQPNPDGTYTLVLSPTEQPGNWIDTAGSNMSFIRNTLGNWGLPGDQLSVSSPSFSLPVLSNSDISSTLDAIATNMTAANASGFRFLFGVNSPGENAFTPVFFNQEIPGSLTTQLAAYGNYSLEPDQALIVQTPKVDAAYSGFQLSNVYGVTSPYATTQSSLDNIQAFHESDGSTYYVISNQDPGVANWIDDSGLAHGTILVRWQDVTGPVPTSPIQVEVVNIDDVRNYLPADTPLVTPAERAADLQDRLLEYGYHLHQSFTGTNWVASNLEYDQFKAAIGSADFDKIFGAQQDVPSVWDRLTEPALNPNWATVAQELLTNPAGSLSAMVNNLPLAVKDIELPMVLAALRLDYAIAGFGQTGLQGLETVFNNTLTDPATSITAGFINAYDDLAVSIMNADSYSPLSSGDFTSVWDQLSELDQSVSQMLSAGFSYLLDSAGA